MEENKKKAADDTSKNEGRYDAGEEISDALRVTSDERDVRAAEDKHHGMPPMTDEWRIPEALEKEKDKLVQYFAKQKEKKDTSAKKEMHGSARIQGIAEPMAVDELGRSVSVKEKLEKQLIAKNQQFSELLAKERIADEGEHEEVPRPERKSPAPRFFVRFLSGIAAKIRAYLRERAQKEVRHKKEVVDESVKVAKEDGGTPEADGHQRQSGEKQLVFSSEVPETLLVASKETEEGVCADIASKHRIDFYFLLAASAVLVGSLLLFFLFSGKFSPKPESILPGLALSIALNGSMEYGAIALSAVNRDDFVWTACTLSIADYTGKVYAVSVPEIVPNVPVRFEYSDFASAEGQRLTPSSAFVRVVKITCRMESGLGELYTKINGDVQQ